MDLNLEDVFYTVVLMMPSLFTLDRQEITSLYEQGGEFQIMASYCGCDCCVNQPHK